MFLDISLIYFRKCISNYEQIAVTVPGGWGDGGKPEVFDAPAIFLDLGQANGRQAITDAACKKIAVTKTINGLWSLEVF